MADLTLLLAPRGPVEAIQWPGDWTDRHSPPALDVLRRWVADRHLDDDTFKVLGPQELGRMVVGAGLTDWLLTRVA